MRIKRKLNILLLLWLGCSLTGSKLFADDPLIKNSVLEIDDPLTNSSTKGIRNGGQFTQKGWQTKTWWDYIQYNIETCPKGIIEFKLTGMAADFSVFPQTWIDPADGQEKPVSVHHSIFNMWDRDEQNLWFGKTFNGVKQWHNPWKCVLHVYGYTPGDLYKWRWAKLRLNVAAFSGGYQDDPHAFENPAFGPINWTKDHVYHFRLEWGDGHMRLYIDGDLKKDWDYSSFGVEYAPPQHSIRIGSGIDVYSKTGAYQCPLNITYSDFKFYRYQDTTPPFVASMEPIDNGSGVFVDSDITISFSEPMDTTATKAAFSITPSIPGYLKWVNNVLYFRRTGLLQPATTYTVRVTTSAKDIAGLPMASEFVGRFTTKAATPTVVKKYEMFEVPLMATGLGNINKYKDVSLKGVFQGPTKTITIEGFWDGDDLWKVRMTPTEVGRWTYQITSSVPQLNASGSFECVDSEHKGFIRVNPQHPYSFMYDDGTPWPWLGDTAWRGFTGLLPYDSRWKYIIDLRARQGYTAMQSIVVSFINGAAFWSNEGGPCFAFYENVKDYDRLNPYYFRWIDKRIDYANSKGIVPVIFMSWAQEYALFSSAQWERFMRYMIARWASKNIIWIICGEYNEIVADFGRPTSEFDHWGRVIKQYDPYKHLISLHPSGRGTSAEFAHTSWMDFIMQQTGEITSFLQRDRVYNKPVVNGEPTYFYPPSAGYGNNDVGMLWWIICGGGFYTAGFHTVYAPDKGGWSPEALPDEQRWVEVLNNVVRGIPFHRMDPHPEWISSGALLAEKGKSYLAFNSTPSPVTLNLTGVTGSLPARWINPYDGTMSDQFTVRLGASALMTPPFNGPWALYIGEGLQQDDVPPLPPQELTAESITIKSIKLSWQPPKPAADGDVAVKYIIYRDNEKIATVDLPSYNDSNLKEAHEYTYRIYSVDDAGNQSVDAAIGQFRTLADLEPPILMRVEAVARDTVVAYFSEPVDSLSAININNYQILQGLNIFSAKLLADRASVKLHTARHAENRYYSLIARKIADRSRQSNRMGPNNVKSYRYGADFKVTNLTPPEYQWAYLHVGDEYYIDRTYTLLDIPAAYQNLLWLKTKNDDKQVSGNQFVSFTITASATIYIAYDESIVNIPAWLSSWTKTGDRIITTDNTALVIYKKVFPAGAVVLGGNGGGKSNSMYVVLVKPDVSVVLGKQLQPPRAVKVYVN